MTKEERAALIAERFKTKHPFAVVENTGKTLKGLWRRRPYCMDRNPRGHRLGMPYASQQVKGVVHGLVREIGKEQTETRAPEVRTKRGRGAAKQRPITRIAQKLADPRLPKLARKYVWQADI